MCLSNRPPPPRMRSKPCERIGRERERREETESEPSSDLRTSLEVSRSNRLRLSLPCRMLAGLQAREHVGFRRVSAIHRFPAPKSSCVSWIRARLPLRGSPGVAPGSLLLSDNAQRTSTDHSLLRHPIFVNSDSAGHGRIGGPSARCRTLKSESRPLSLPGPTPQVRANTCSLLYVVPEERTDERRALSPHYS